MESNNVSFIKKAGNNTKVTEFGDTYFKVGKTKPATPNFVKIPDPHKAKKSNTPKVFAGSSISYKSTIALKFANTIMQPVGSTSKDSTYHVIAIGSDLKIAARYKPSQVSVRAEGNITKHYSRLKEAGFEVYPSKKYASFHVPAEGVLRYKVLGAALGGLNYIFTEVLTNFALLDNKGS